MYSNVYFVCIFFFHMSEDVIFYVYDLISKQLPLVAERGCYSEQLAREFTLCFILFFILEGCNIVLVNQFFWLIPLIISFLIMFGSIFLLDSHVYYIDVHCDFLFFFS